MSQSRGVRVRNDNDIITYSGNWSIVQASAVNQLVSLNSGPAYSPTLHSTTTTGSFAFPFSGSSISVSGSTNIANLSQSNQDPSWTCTIDGSVHAPPDLSSFNRRNNRSLCVKGGLSDGPHELIVNVTSQGMPFYLDFIQYTPSPDISLENSLIFIATNDPTIDFISGWKPLGIRNGTTDPEGLVNVTFIGTQLSWYGDIPNSQPPYNASSGKFSVDGQPYTSFEIPPGLDQQLSAPAGNQFFFNTPVLEMGTHMLSAKYTGSSGQTPFTFEYLIITNGTFSSTGTLPTNSSGDMITPSPVPSSNGSTSKLQTGSIIGGVVGGVVGIVVSSIALFFWFTSRKRNGMARRGNISSVINPYSVFPSDNLVSPYPTNSETPSGTTWPLLTTPSLVTQFISPRPRKCPAPIGAISNTITPAQHQDSGIRLSQSIPVGLSVEAPPVYSPS